MSETQFTPAQLDAIQSREENLLVAAGAGSGKTTVLVERIIRRLRSGGKIQRLLVLTFTHAAADDMRAKIQRALSQLCREQPGNADFRQQLALLPQAHISTVHSFCLELLRSHYYRVGLPADFRVASEVEMELLRQECLEACMEQAYGDEESGLAALADAYGAKKVYTDLEAFFADENVNFVYIASPNSLHYAQARQALLAGKNVICEKPFCAKASQAKELVQLARERGLFLVDAVPTAFLPNFQVVKRELEKVGRIRLVLSCFSQYSSRYDRLLAGEVPNVFSPEFAGGCLMDINFYNVYLNVSPFGKPENAVYYPNRFGDLVDTSGVLVMQYPDFVSQCAGAKDTWGVNSVQIQGEKGYLYVKDGSGAFSEVTVVTKTARETINLQPCENRWRYEVEEMTRRLLSGDRAFFDKNLEIMIQVMEVLEQTRKQAGILFPGD